MYDLFITYSANRQKFDFYVYKYSEQYSGLQYGIENVFRRS